MANNIKHQLFSGVFYTALAKYSGIIISLVVAGILARLLSPDDFGVVAIATVIIAFFNLFTDMGISPAIVQHKSLTKEELSDIFSFTVWTGIGISILFFAASWLDCRLLRKWDLTDVVPAPVRQPVLRLCQHRAGSLVLPQQRVQVYCCPKLYHPDSRRCRSNNCRALRSRLICADHQSYTFQHTDIRYFLSTLSATAAFHVRTESTPKDILLFGLSILV